MNLIIAFKFEIFRGEMYPRLSPKSNEDLLHSPPKVLFLLIKLRFVEKA